MAAPTADVLIVGGGLAGALLALELRRRDARVMVVEAEPGPQALSATALSYGAIPGWPLANSPLARAAAAAAWRWRDLQHGHGDLGWRPVCARLLGGAPGTGLLARFGLLPMSQVDPAVLLDRLPAVLTAAGVQLRPGRVLRLDPGPGRGGSGGWRVSLSDGLAEAAEQLVLAAGAGCRRLWPGLPPTLQRSWAGVLELPSVAPPRRWGRSELLLPGRFNRLALERRSQELAAAAWVVDAGLVPRSGGSLLGQISWIAAACEAETAAPVPAQAEVWLREALLAADPLLAGLVPLQGARYRQVPVAFCRDGRPLATAVAGAPGLWLFSGFSGGFAQVPVLAPLLAAAITAEGATAGVRADLATRELQRLGVWSGLPSSSAAG
jgi:glycine/D-amino acid oxidase-like deaminating enzyme